jgi:prolyl oligopeptidase
VTEDGRYLVITVSKGTDSKYRVLVKDLQNPDAPLLKVVDNFDHEYSYVGNDATLFYFLTDHEAPRRRLVAFDIHQPEKEHHREVIPQVDETLDDVNLVGDTLIASYLKDATTQVKLFKLDGERVGEVQLPGIGSAHGFGGRRADNETFYSFSSFATPPSIYRYDLETGESTLMRQAKVDFDPALYTVRQVFYHSKDGTRVPMFLAHKKGIKLDGSNPTILYGYGGFNIPLTPGFSVSRLAWMELGGVFVMANLRGGGEYGEAWHQGGTKLNKQNVFDDFVAAAEWLIEHKVTRPDRLAIQGGSNGGLLVGAAMTQRPELFGACLPAVGVMDMLRFHKFTAGRYWVDDYGSSDDPQEFAALRAYSPYHNLKPGTKYPATMIMTADTDDRVVPGHSFKFAAELQNAHAGDAPVVIRIESRAGHGAGTPTSKLIDRVADQWAFLVQQLNVDLTQHAPHRAEPKSK